MNYRGIIESFSITVNISKLVSCKFFLQINCEKAVKTFEDWSSDSIIAQDFDRRRNEQ